jgi:hypothetical protein
LLLVFVGSVSNIRHVVWRVILDHLSSFRDRYIPNNSILGFCRSVVGSNSKSVDLIKLEFISQNLKISLLCNVIITNCQLS